MHLQLSKLLRVLVTELLSLFPLYADFTQIAALRTTVMHSLWDGCMSSPPSLIARDDRQQHTHIVCSLGGFRPSG